MTDVQPAKTEASPPEFPELPVTSIPDTPPLSALPEDPPTASLADCAPCCTFSAEKKFNSIADTTYFANPLGYWEMRNKGRIEVATAAAPDAVVIKKTITITYQMGATEDAHGSAILGAIQAAFQAWESYASAYRIRVKMLGCPDKDLRILFRYNVVPSGGDIVIRVDNTPAPPDEGDELRSFVAGGTDMTYYLNGGDDWVMIHEIGHTIGLGDEYVYDRPSQIEPVITIYGFDMSDFVMTIPYAGEQLPKADAPPGAPTLYMFENPTVMGMYGNTVSRKYMFYWVTYETSQALSDEARLNGVEIV